MTFMEMLTNSIKSLLEGIFVYLVFFVGIFELIIDTKNLKNEGNDRDAKLARGIGISYIIAGPILYIIGRLI